MIRCERRGVSFVEQFRGFAPCLLGNGLRNSGPAAGLRWQVGVDAQVEGTSWANPPIGTQVTAAAAGSSLRLETR